MRGDIDALFTNFRASLKEDVVNQIRGKNNEVDNLPKIKKSRFSEK